MIVFSLLLALATTPAQESERLDAFFEEVFQEELAHDPMGQARLGIKRDYDRWNDLSNEAALARYKRAKRALGRLWTEFDIVQLDEQSRISYRLFEKIRQNSIEAFEWRFHRYPVNQMHGGHTLPVNFLLNMHRIDDISDAEAYIKRLETLDQPLKELRHTLITCQEIGVLPPRFVFDHVLRDCRNIVSGAPFSNGEDTSTLLADFMGKVASLTIKDDEESELVNRAIQALSRVVQPAYEELIELLESQKELATEEDGCWKFPDGAAFYAQALQRTTTTKLSAHEIHEHGLAEVARIHGEMRAIMQHVKYEGSLSEFFEHLRKDERFYYPNTDAGRAAYLVEATRLVDSMKARIPQLFGTLPKAEMVVRAVEPYRERSAGKAFYQRGTPDGTRPGVYYANLYDMAAMPKYQMEALAFHEGIPGHHMQISIAQELEGLPNFRKHAHFTAYSEGWGLYTEHFPKEFGFYSDPYSDFGRLAMQLWRACRLVVDTGIHDKRWTRQQAIDYLLENTPNPESDAIKVIERYIVLPSQATAYMIGMLEILEVRESARRRLGDKFDIRQFHDVLLTNGPVPLSLLTELVETWVISHQD